MGCDIHSFAEVKRNSKWEKVNNHFSIDNLMKKYEKKDKGYNPFYWRCYSVFAFLADVRNYDKCKPLSSPKGIPSDVSDEIKEEYKNWEGDAHSSSYLTLRELTEFDYNKTFWNRRIIKNNNGATLAEKGEGKIITYKENLGLDFFKHLSELKKLGNIDNVRIVFWFDN